MAFGGLNDMEFNNFQMIVLAHYSRYPQSQTEDLYKLAYQGALGSEHAIEDTASARNWLAREINGLPESSAEPLIDEISPGKHIVRIHLKPYLDAGGDPENLLEAFIKTANEYQGSIELLTEYWLGIESLAKRSGIKFSHDQLRAFFESMESLNFPAIHHSEQYIKAYQPSYRVIRLDYLPGRDRFNNLNQ